jgi:hypothetical protein
MAEPSLRCESEGGLAERHRALIILLCLNERRRSVVVSPEKFSVIPCECHEVPLPSGSFEDAARPSLDPVFGVVH